MNMNQKALDALLKMASQKVGTTPDNLKNQLESGQFQNLTKNMKPADAEKFKQLVGNQQMMEQLMSTPQAQELYKKLTEEK